MSEDAKYQLWQIVQTVVGGLVVASLLGLAGSLIAVRDAVLQHDVLLQQLREFQSEGGRYTARDGAIETRLRDQADTLINEKVKAIEATHEVMWDQLRSHMSRPQHQGVEYRLKPLEEHLKKPHSSNLLRGK